MNLRFESFEGAAIRAVFEPLAQLRIEVFRDFPYLYEGSLEYEKTYLETYARSQRALVHTVFDGDRMVGATTCIPLTDETPEVQRPFIQAGYDLGTVFYFGESILLPGYRGQGLGHRFFDVREAHAARFATTRYTSFCAVSRPENHPMRPPDYRPLDTFWESRGYHREEALQTQFDWPDLGETESTEKPMIFWIKAL